MTHILLGTVTLTVAVLVSLSMLRSARIHLSTDEQRLFKWVRRKNQVFFPICITLIVTYLSVRRFLPEYHLANVLFLWTSYNIMLWIKMRRILHGFQRVGLPLNFQLNYIFSQIISYTGLVVSMLILSQGNQL